MSDFTIANDLYQYSCCPFDVQGVPLSEGASVADASWLIFDNVYARTSGGRSPENAQRERARQFCGFMGKGGPRSPARGKQLWAATVDAFGSPGATSETMRRPQLEEPPTEPPAPTAGGAYEAASGDVSGLAARVIRSTHELWTRLRGQYAFSDAGFMTFYSPVRADAALVIVGANPGGGADSFNLAEALRVPPDHDYFRYDYPMARSMRNLFAEIGRTQILRESVKLNLNFFRSADASQWQTVPPAIRSQMESHCREAVSRLIRELHPAVVLTEGIATFDQLRSLVRAGNTETLVHAADGRRLICHARFGADSHLIGMVHPTGAQVSTAARARVAEALNGLLADAIR